MESVRVQGTPGDSLQTMIGEMAIATAQEKGNDPEEQSRQSLWDLSQVNISKSCVYILLEMW